MKMRCHYCQREVTGSEFIANPMKWMLDNFGKVTDFLAILVDVYNKYSQTRGMLDSNLAGIANAYKIECPACNKCLWDPVDEEKERLEEILRLKIENEFLKKQHPGEEKNES